MSKKIILDTVGIALTLYVFGFLWVMTMVATGYEGGDMLTEHYRSTLQAVVSFF